MSVYLSRDADQLPDGTVLRDTAFFINGTVQDWTGRKCLRCEGCGEAQDEGYRVGCPECAGTGDEHGPLWLWEE